MMAPQFLALNTAERAARNPLIGSAVIDDMNRKPATQIAENGNAGHRLASGPEAKPLKAIPSQICPADFDGVLDDSPWPKSQRPDSCTAPGCLSSRNTCAVIVFPDSQRQGASTLADLIDI
jgi:hypothetical protein